MGGGAYEHRDPMMWKPRNSERGKGWTADLWTDYALKYIREHRDGPWFASVAYIIPHLPWVCDEKYSAPFIAQGCSTNLAACYGSIAHMDECIGRLLDGLKETGQEQRTIVVFLSDNGPTSPETKTKTMKNSPGYRLVSATSRTCAATRHSCGKMATACRCSCAGRGAFSLASASSSAVSRMCCPRCSISRRSKPTPPRINLSPA